MANRNSKENKSLFHICQLVAKSVAFARNVLYDNQANLRRKKNWHMKIEQHKCSWPPDKYTIITSAEELNENSYPQ